MSFDRPGLPHPGHKSNEPDVAEDLHAEGVELNPDGDLDGLDHPGTVSAGPQPNPPRRPAHEVAEAVEKTCEETGEVVDDPAHEDPAHDPDRL